MNNYLSQSNVAELSERLKNLTIESVGIDDSKANDFLVVNFTDGSKLRLEYDWIYGYEVTQ